MRVRNQLLILVLSTLVPAFISAVLAVWYVYSEEQKKQEKGVTEAARTFALLVDNELRAKENTLTALANSPVLAEGNLTGFYSYAKSLAPTPETTIILSDWEGRQLFNTRVPLGTVLPTQRSSNIGELMQKYGADKTLISDLFLAPIAKSHDFSIQVPIKKGKYAGYFLVMGVNASVLHGVVLQQRFPGQWTATVVDRKGKVVARSRNPEKYVGQTVRHYTRQVLSASREGVYQSVTLDGIPVKAFFSRVPNADWSVLISIPESEIRRVSTQATAFLAGIMLLLMGMAIVAARWLARRTIRPIESLGETADKLGQGEEVSYIPYGMHEVDAAGLRIAEASKQIRRAKLDLEQRVAEAVAATEQAQRALLQSQKLEALGRLTGGIAHEFNNLLQTLMTALQLAKMISNQERVQSLIDTCNKAVNRAAVLTGQLSSFGRIQEAKLATVRLNDAIENFRQLIANILPSNIGLEIRLQEALWPVTVDSLQLELSLLNIAINARDAMPKGGTLVFEAANHVLSHPLENLHAGEYVRLRITDNGCGMTPEVLAQALDPFFTTKAIGKGTGLGLPQAYGFARQSHGTLILQSIEGAGTTVEIYLPRAQEALSETASVKSEQKHTVTAHGTVLFVEDDPLVREAMVPALEKTGFTVLSAICADDALAMLEAGAKAEVVFSDIVMPGQMSGIDLARIVSEKFPDMKVILATGYTEQRISLPDVKLLAKPYDMAEAVQTISDVMALPGASASSA